MKLAAKTDEVTILLAVPATTTSALDKNEMCERPNIGRRASCNGPELLVYSQRQWHRGFAERYIRCMVMSRAALMHRCLCGYSAQGSGVFHTVCHTVPTPV